MNRLFLLISILLFTLGLVGQQNYYPLPDVYHTYPEMIADVKQICHEYSKLARWEIIGHSGYSKKPIYAIRVSNHAKVNFKSRPTLLIHGSSQGEEVIGVEISLRILQDVLSSYNHSTEITELLNTFELWFVPTMNPEGFDSVTSGEYFLCRKNKTDTNFNGYLEIRTDGVDLNKNFDFNWFDFAFPYPQSLYFKGHCPASESEVLAMQEFFHNENFTYALNYHSSATGNFSEKIFFPWNDGSELSPDYQHYLELGESLVEYLPKDYLPGNYELHLGTTTMIGYLRHYLYAETRTLAFDIETGGNTKDGNSIIRPGKAKLNSILNKHLLAFRSFTRKVIDNTVSIRVVDYNKKPQPNIFADWAMYQSSYFNEFKTNSSGYLFRYLPKDDTQLILKNKYSFVISPENSDVQKCIIPFTSIPSNPVFEPHKTKHKQITYCNDISSFNTYPIYSDCSIRSDFNGVDFGVRVIKADTLSILTTNSSCELEISLYNRYKKFLRKVHINRDRIEGAVDIPLKVSVKEKAYIVIKNLSSETFCINMEKDSAFKNSNVEVRFQSWKPEQCSDLALELK